MCPVIAWKRQHPPPHNVRATVSLGARSLGEEAHRSPR